LPGGEDIYPQPVRAQERQMMRLPEQMDVNGFDPDAIEVLHRAYMEACNALHVYAGDQHGRQTVAARVIDLATTTGVLDAKALRDRVLLESRVGV
jgi:hypothetical protein